MVAAGVLPLPARVVEVIAELGAGGQRYGSGCIVAGRTVLTAAHVVAGAHRVWVRGPDKRKLPCRPVDHPGFVGDPGEVAHGPDLALVEIEDDSIDLPAMGLARVDRDTTSGDAVERCHAQGYPQFAERPAADGAVGTVRETVDAAGVVAVGSGRVFGLLDLQVSLAPRDLPPQDVPLEDSPWSGISGGPVTAAGRLLGVVSEHAVRAGPGSLTATPLTAISHDPEHTLWGPGVADPAAWWARLRVASPDELTVLPPRRQAPYAATVRAIGRALRSRLPRLSGRDMELAAIAAFATGTVGYRWLVGGAFTGKTALMHHAVTAALPDTVDVVSYFLRRVASDADSGRFLAAVIPQLAALCDVDVPGLDESTYRSLWEQAVRRAGDTGRHLLLVLDGLDEDLHPPGLPSVALLLPDLVAGGQPGANHAHVHVTSRPHPQLPIELRDTPSHPLNHVHQTQLSGFPGWEELRDLGLAEIDELVAAGGVARDVFGLLAAAAGPLSLDDLLALHTAAGQVGVDADWYIENLLTRKAARSVEPVGTADRERFQFAHATLLRHAQTHPALAKPAYRQRLHALAETWRQAGWPDPADDTAGTPLYLLDTYPATLEAEHDRLTALAGDIGWVDAAIRATGVDAALAVLHAASAGGDRTVTNVLAVVSAQVVNLRAPHPVHERGYVLRHAGLQALRYGMEEIATAAQTRMQTLTDPGPIPLSTSERSTPPALELGTHDGWGWAVAVAPDGAVVTGGWDGRVRLWQRDRPGQPTELGSHDGWVMAVAVAPDGAVVTGGNDGRVRLWRRDRPGQPTELGSHDGWVMAVAVAPDGAVITGGNDGRVRLWRRDRPGQPTELGSHDGPVRALAVTPDGAVITGGGDRRVRLWRRDRPGQPTELGSHDGPVGALAVTPDGAVITGGDRRVRLWRRDRPGQPTELGSHDDLVRALAVTPDGAVITGGDDGRVRLWRRDRPGQPTELGSHDGWVLAVAVAPDGAVITVGDDRRVRLWRRDRPGRPTELGTYDGWLSAVAVAPDGAVITGGDDGRVRLWQRDRPGQPSELGTHDIWVGAVAVAPDGAVITGGGDGRVRLWRRDRPGQPTELGSHDGPVRALAVAPDGAVITGGNDGRVRLWRRDRPGQPTELGAHDGWLNAVAVAPDGAVITGGGDGRVRLWRRDRPGQPTELGAHDGPVRALAVTPDGAVITGGNDGRVRLWRRDRPGQPTELGTHDGPVRALAVTPDGVVVTVGDDRRVRLWRRHRPGQPGPEMNVAVYSLAVGPGPSRRLVLAHDRSGWSMWSIPPLDHADVP